MTAPLLEAFALFVALLAAGAHAAVPASLARPDAAAGRALWARAALPLGLALALGALLRVRLDPSPFLGAGLVPIGPSPVTTAALVALGTWVLVDLFVAFAHPRLEPVAWRFLAVVGGLGLAAWSAFEEAARIGSGPAVSLGDYLGATLARTTLGFATAALVFTRPGPSLARALGVAGALAALGLWGLSSSWVRGALAEAGDPLTLVAGAALLGLGPFLPPRFRRLSAVLGAVLLALFLARAGAVSEQLGLTSRVPPPLP